MMIYKKFQNEFTIGQTLKKNYGSDNEDEKYTKPITANNLDLSENLLLNTDTKKKEGSSTSTCPLRRCCRICGC